MPLHLPSAARSAPVSRRGLLAGGLAGGVAAATLTPSAATAGRGRPGGPVRGHRVRGARLTLSSAGRVQRNGVDFRTGGFNAFQLVTNDYPSPRLMTYPEIDSLLLKAVSTGAFVVRAHTLAASVGNPCTLVRGVSGSGPNPRITYDPAVWDVIDYAVWRAHRLGVYLVAPFVDELGYFHGGKRHWVDFRHPGSVSLDPSVNAANSRAQRAAEDLFYLDPQVRWDFQQYVRDWLTHVNPRTGTAFKDEAALSIVQVGNELWTAAQDAPTWVADTAAVVKSVSPTTLVMDSGADGLAVDTMAWASPDVDILETHPYTTFGASDVDAMANFAAAHGKAFAVGEYAWSKSSAPQIEAVVRGNPAIFTSAPWSLQNDQDLHNAGAPYGGDDVSLYVPGKDAVQQAAARRLAAHHAVLNGTGLKGRSRQWRAEWPGRG